MITRIVLLLLLLTPAFAAAQGSNTDIVRGRVVGDDGAPIRGALVEGWSQQSGVRRATTTNAEGMYTLLFPDGGGRFRLRVSHLGREPYETEIARAGDEEVLLHDVRLGTRPVEVEGVVAQGRRTLPPGRGESGTVSRGLDGSLTNRLPLENTDPASIAALTPGVVPLAGADSIGGQGGFSIAGQRASQNQVTLDGATFASMLSGGALGGGMGLPQEGMRSTQVITNTYDVARGQFSGGQVAMTTQAGTNTRQGSLSYRLGDDRLQGGAGHGEWTDGFRQNRVSGGLGGALKADRLFYNLSLAGQRRVDGLFALAPRSTAGFSTVGASADSVARFLDIASRMYGLSGDQTGGYDRRGDGFSGLARFDFNASDRHSLSVRGFASGNEMGQAFIGPLDALENGGQMRMSSDGVIATATSQLGTSWVNEARLSYTRQSQEMWSDLRMPEARVRVSTADAAGPLGMSTLAFGGDPFPPRQTGEQTIEAANEVSWLLGSWHRIKLGGFFNRTRFEQEAAMARNGIFSFNSLDDLEAGRPSAFTRSLLTGPTVGSGWNAALYLGDTWRITDALQVVFGARLESSGYGDALTASSEAGGTFGMNTGYAPNETRISPRLGFSWRLSELGRPLRNLRGGFGEFRGRTPYSLYAGVLDAARGSGEALLSCVGPGLVPAADFLLFRANPEVIPSRCADGSAGRLGAAGLPSVTAFSPDFQSPRSWRASLGYQTALRPLLNASIDGSYARGVAQYGVRDLNLASVPRFNLTQEGDRPVFAPMGAIDPASGMIPLAASRRDPRFGNAYEVHSDLASEAASVTFALSGVLIGRRISFQTGYTLGYARDQSSFTFGGAAQGFGRTETSGDPNRPGWAASSADRRHVLNGVVGIPIGQSWEASFIANAMSGAPFTPRVGGDVNGDGARNDIAFVFDPSRTADAGLAAGMRRVLEDAPGGASSCLRSQLGLLADRNSCRGQWSFGLDLRVQHTPEIGRLGRRLSMGVDVMSVPSGVDLLLHGAAGRRGWGEAGFMTDDVLLQPRGFDPASGSFRYEVNPRFGQPMGRAMGMRSPFGIQLSGRLAVGPDRGREPLGGFAGLGMGGGGTMVRVTVGGPGGGEGAPMPGGPGGGGIRIMSPGSGGGPGGASMLDILLPMPLDGIVAMRDSLGLSEEQARRLDEIRAELVELNTPIRAEVGRAMGGGAGPGGDPGALFQRVGPRVNEGRINIQRALDQVRELLTPEQWEQIPVNLREAASRGQVRIGGE